MASLLASKPRSKIYAGRVMHSRTGPVDHTFAYPVYFYALDLDELPSFNSWIFGYNKKRVAAIFDQDYLDNSGLTIKEKVLSYLSKNNLNQQIERIVLITSARYFNYVFNPVSFYYCYNKVDELIYVVSEVNNTFSERHLYLLHQELSLDDKSKYAKHYTVPKSFHVSPFYPMDGMYDFWLTEPEEQLDIKINVLREKDRQVKVDFYSRVWGEGAEFNTINLLKIFVKFPLTASLTYPRIVYQAAKMYYIKKLPVFRKPKPVSAHTIFTGPPSYLHSLAQNKIIKLFRGFDRGFLKIILPDNRILFFGDAQQLPQAEIQVQHYEFFWRLVRDGAIGLGESYTDKLWETGDITAVVDYFIANKEKIEKRNRIINYFFDKVEFLRHLFRFNSLAGAKKNISAHYDLSNDLFKTFLDSSMMYSSALYSPECTILEAAQANKIDSLIRKARITKADHVLEIGSGWGSFAITLAKQVGCHVTSITISQEQFNLAKERVKEAKLEHLVEIKFCDYREVTGQFDKIVSIEMLEAIGHKNYQSFFRTCEKLLKPNGLIALQVITIHDQYFERLKNRCDWIQKHIFPGSLLPSLEALQIALRKNSELEIEEITNIGPHYAPTLAEWRKRFNRNLNQVFKLGFDERFIRAWNYYLAYCESAFATRTLNVLHLTLTRPNNQVLCSEDRQVLNQKYFSQRSANV